MQQAIVLAYNADTVSPNEAPKGWPELWSKDEYKDRHERVNGMGAATTAPVR
ncbi:hypothetical protein [Arthrobacter sp. D2-10]